MPASGRYAALAMQTSTSTPGRATRCATRAPSAAHLILQTRWRLQRAHRPDQGRHGQRRDPAEGLQPALSRCSWTASRTRPVRQLGLHRTEGPQPATALTPGYPHMYDIGARGPRRHLRARPSFAILVNPGESRVARLRCAGIGYSCGEGGWRITGSTRPTPRSRSSSRAWVYRPLGRTGPDAARPRVRIGWTRAREQRHILAAE